MIAAIWLPLLVLAATLPQREALLREDEEIPFEKWECGSDHGFAHWVGADKKTSYAAIIKSCPNFAAELNHCCVVHDDCYGRGVKGQKWCDQRFYDCGLKVLEDERAGPCAEHVETAKKKLDEYGSLAYGGGHTEAPESELPQLCRPERTVGVFFDYLYLSCPTVKKQISSCCDQLTLCPDLPLGRNRTECANRAMVCLGEVRAEEPAGFNAGHCDRALNRTSKYLALDYIMEEAYRNGQLHEIFAQSRQAFGLLMLLSLMCGLGLLLMTYKYYRLRIGNETRQ